MTTSRDERARPVVDVGVVTWNTADLTATSLRKMLDSDQGVDIRLLVRDNASSDGTVDRLTRDVPEAEVDAGAENLGFAGGVNTLIRRSTAPWFFVLNSDAWPLEGTIGRLVRGAELHPRAAAIVPRIEYPDGQLQHSTHPFPSLRVAANVAFRRDRLTPERADELFLEGAWQHDRPRQVDWAYGAAMLIPRAALDAVGGFDERFFFYAEDLEWCWRAHTLGLDIWFEPSAVVHHMENASGEQLYASVRTRAHMRNSLRFYRRAHGTPSAAAWWSLNVAGGVVRFAQAVGRRDRADATVWRRFLRAQVESVFVRERRPGGPIAQEDG
jgi:N-acetylglucosaminyl-diphospho-decaprenol L-rhamnosyltransferase